MATLIVQCRNCQKDVEIPNDVDLSKPGMDKTVGNLLKDGTWCEACTAEYSRNMDESYFCPEPNECQIGVKPTLPYAQAVEKGKKLLRRYKPLTLPTEPMFTEREVAKPYPKLEYDDQVLYCCTAARITCGRRHQNDCPSYVL